MKRMFKIEFNPERVYGLDILRAFAILTVVIGHGGHLIPKEWKWNGINNYFVFDGVSIFFVLSGFLIGGILIRLLERNKISINLLADFWIRRWFRTLPAYFLVLITLACIEFFTNDNFTFWSINRYFIFSQNLFQPHSMWFFTEAWSLSIEEWFYLTVPLIIVLLIGLLRMTSRNALLLTAAFIILAVTAFRYYRFENIPIESVDDFDLLFRKQVVTRLDSLMFGVIGAYLQFYNFNIWKKYKSGLLIAGVSLLLLINYILPHIIPFEGLYNAVFSFSLISAATLALLPFLSELKMGKGKLFKILTYISLTSYSMYLIHLSLVQGMIRLLPWDDLLSNEFLIVSCQYSLYWFLVITLSVLIYKYFEAPMTKLRNNVKLKRTLKEITTFNSAMPAGKDVKSRIQRSFTRII